MKIVQIATFPINSDQIKGGVEASVYGLATELAKTHEVAVIDLPRKEIPHDYTEHLDGIDIYRFNARSGSNYMAISRIPDIIRIIRHTRPDICHLHTTNLFCLIVFILLRINRKPAILTLHGLIHREKQHQWRKFRTLRNMLKYWSHSLAEFVFLTIAKRVVVDTLYVADAIRLYRKEWKIWRMPLCHVIPQGIDNIYFTLKDEPESDNLLSVGTISKRKGHLQLIEAIALIKRHVPTVRLTIVGPLFDRKYYEQMRELINEKHLEDQIRICTDVPLNSLLNFYSHASVFVLHSEEESQGIAFCEAMAAGKPVVATTAGGIPCVVKHNINGLLCGFDDISSFAENITALLTNENQRREMSLQNRKDAVRYNWRLIASDIVSIYTSLIIK
jgi:glycosyltransferase involved in cell wall biosynthesis